VNSYFSTITTGLEEVAETALKQRIRDVRIELLGDGLVLYQTASPRREIQSLSFFSNTFILFRRFDHLPVNPAEAMLRHVTADPTLANIIAPNVPDRPSSFRLIFREDRLVPVDNNRLCQLENRIAQIKQLSVNRRNPELEFWFLARREGFGVFGLRLTRHRDYAKLLEKGELRPELAAMMCLLAEPSRRDVFLDPFAGSGAIPLARVKVAAYTQVIGSDSNPHLVEKLRKRVRGINNKIEVHRWDALNLESLARGAVDTIVTDPPWGLHVGTELNLRSFYEEMLGEFHRILRPEGFVVVLLAKKELFDEILEEWQDRFTLISKYDTLVSGPKAALYKLKKRSDLEYLLSNQSLTSRNGPPRG
jgi:16S rRNA G966 N2-methylase RsmD